MDDKPTGRLAAEVFAQMIQVVHRVGLAGGQELRAHDLTPAQYQLLGVVQRRPGLVQRELTEALGVTKGNVSQLLTRLEEASLIQREADGVANQITLTERGEALMRVLVPAQKEFFARSFSALTFGELQILADLTSRLRASL